MSLRPAIVIALSFLSCLFASAQNALPNTWVYSSFLGGNQQDSISAQALDTAGNVYVTGTTASPNFPTTAGVYEPTFPGPRNDSVIFVSKFSPEGALIWILLSVGAIPSIVGKVGGVAFLVQFILVWLGVWLVANGPMRVPFIRWRFRGGRLA